jgi:hypothetical protein
MLRDYLCQISNIIYSKIPNAKNQSDTRNRADAKREIDRVIKTNNIILNTISQSNKFAPKKYNHQSGSGSGIQGLSESIDRFGEINDKLHKLLGTMNGADMNQINEEIMEIASVAITLIKFLGELINKNGDESLTKVQEQVADIVLGLEKYLE